MTTVINNPGTGDSSDSSLAVIIGTLLVLVLVGLFLVYALPYIRRGNAAPQGGSINVNLKLPAKEISPVIDPTQAPATPAY